ncbi:MAG: hypothetical protein EBV42_05695, partial [Actinobacteria bacterium]|nr:hypothetical protein [Actinomycetota bacterium]
MQRPGRFEHTRFLGDKRTQLVYDVDAWSDAALIDDIVATNLVPVVMRVLFGSQARLDIFGDDYPTPDGT